MHTEFEVIIFDSAENHLCGRLQGDCCLKSLKEKQIILYSKHLQKKTIALLHQEWKKYIICCENHIFIFVLFTTHSWIIIRQFTIKVPVKTAKQSISAALD